MTFSSLGQTRKYYSTRTPKQTTDFVVLKKDTVYHSISTVSKKVVFDSEDDANEYMMTIFHHRNAKYLKQWKEEVTVFISKELKPEILKKFKAFVQSFPQLKNFKVSIVKDKKLANYFIKTTSDFKSIHDGKGYSEKQKRESNYYNLNYKIRAVGSGFKSCILTFDPKRIYDDKVFLKQLKVVFFTTMGQFQQDSWRRNMSILNYRNDDVHQLTDFDLRLLRYHYQHIFNESIEAIDFKDNYTTYAK